MSFRLYEYVNCLPSSIQSDVHGIERSLRIVKRAQSPPPTSFLLLEYLNTARG